MKILFLGYSNLLKNRILPILDELDYIGSICIAKYIQQKWDDSFKIVNKPVELFENYETAIENSKADIVYISTTNNSHYLLAKATLKAGMHTIIDKPATIHLEETNELLRIAKERNLLLTESVVYTYHPQFDIIKDIFLKENSIPKLVTALFSFPPLDKNNFRYNKSLGGGAFLDTGSYAVSIGRFMFNEIPEQVFYSENESMEDNLEISYSLLLKYSKGRSLIGHFGFNTEYINRLNILGEKLIVDIDRVFTIPDSFSNTINIRSNNKSYNIIAPCGNTFKIYLNAVAESIMNKEFKKLYNDILIDAISRDKINNEISKIKYGN